MSSFDISRWKERWYILDENNKAITTTLLKWGEFMETEKKIVKQEDVGQFWVSTVFLGLDHGAIWHRDKNDYQPLLFETMVVYPDGDQKFFRTPTYEAALKNHIRLVKIMTRMVRMKNVKRN